MDNIKRWYFYIVCAVSLQTVSWAIVELLRNRTVDSIAFLIAVIIVALPLYLLHWRWAKRSEDEVDEIDPDHLRVFYFLAMLAIFLVPIIFNARTFLDAALRTLFTNQQISTRYHNSLSNGEVMINAAVAMGVLGILGLYHLRLMREEKLIAESGVPATLRRTFIYFFTALGLGMFSIGLYRLLLWTRRLIDSSTIAPPNASLMEAAALILTGLLVWIPFWRTAQKLFYSGRDEERDSRLRKTFLYLAVFVGTIIVVTDLTIIGATLLRQLLGLDALEDTGVVLSSLVVGALLWAYHAYVLMEDSKEAPHIEAQVSVRRVYWYLVATVGLLALLIGLGSIISVIINALGGRLGVTESLREQLAWSTAGLISGILVWILPWRNIQREVDLPEEEGLAARDAGVRRYYLFGFILLATLTFLICAIYLVYALLSYVLGVGSDFGFSEVAHAFAFALIATAVWLYHGTILRRDNELLKETKTPFGERPRIVIIDDETGKLGRRLNQALSVAKLEADLSLISLQPVVEAVVEGAEEPSPGEQALAMADIIVAPWSAITPHGGQNGNNWDVLGSLIKDEARKLLIPRPAEGWDWSGVPEWREETAVRQAVQSVKQILAGETVELRKPMGIGRLLLIVVGVLFFLFVLIGVISAMLGF